MPQKPIILSNGIKLIHKEINSPIAHFGILVNAGTRDDHPDKMGLAHFVEHTFFKGTEKRKSYQIIKRLEDVGGDLNASTSKEETYFHASFLTPDYPRTIELLSDIFFHATFPEHEIEKEKDVIIEEINYYKDTPAELIFDEFESLMFQNHPLGQNILGNKHSVKSLKRNDILDFIRRFYQPENIVLSSVGNISTKKLTNLCNHYFANNSFTPYQRTRLPYSLYQPHNVKIKKNISQTHAIIGNLAYSIKEEKQIIFMLLTNLLGGPCMNTRLNMTIREKFGLAYSVEANYSPFSDIGLFSIYLGCDFANTDKCIELIFNELNILKNKPLGTMQLFHAKRQFIGQIALSYETKLNEMLSLGRSALFFDEIQSIEETIQLIEKITANDILEVANEIFQIDNFSQLIFSKH